MPALIVFRKAEVFSGNERSVGNARQVLDLTATDQTACRERVTKQQRYRFGIRCSFFGTKCVYVILHRVSFDTELALLIHRASVSMFSVQIADR